MADYSGSPCPPGYFCLEGDEPQLCPAGTMRDTQGAVNASDCPLCRPGYYCPNDTANTQVTEEEEEENCGLVEYLETLYKSYSQCSILSKKTQQREGS